MKTPLTVADTCEVGAFKEWADERHRIQQARQKAGVNFNPAQCFACGRKALYRWKSKGACSEHKNELKVPPVQ